MPKANRVPRQPTESIPATSPFLFLLGHFGVGDWRIPYLSTNMSFSAAAADLRTTSDIPNDDAIPWTVEELFQRDIDWKRVEQQIVPYLRNERAPQFFNSLTVALLPFDPNTQRLLDGYDDGVQWKVPESNDPADFASTLEVGPVRLSFFDEVEQGRPLPAVGVAQWNKDQVYGVAIDGQHRLAAIKNVVMRKPGSDSVKDSQVSVILLLLDARLGFQAPEDKPVVELLRSLFIDLNKHAKTVSRARQILLDDRDPHAKCVRSLLAGALRGDTDELLACGDDYPRLPLALVDWHSEQAKFDKGPYIATVLGVDSIANLVLGTKPIRDFTDYAAIKKQLRGLSRNLIISLQKAIERVEEYDRNTQIPFTYGPDELDLIATGFAEHWNEALLILFTGLGPYGRLIELRQTLGTYGLAWQEWYRLYSRKSRPGISETGKDAADYNSFIDKLMVGDPPVSEASFLDKLHEIEEAKEETPLAFAVVFQKAMFMAYLRLVGLPPVASAELNEALTDLDLEPTFDDVDYEFDDDEVNEVEETSDATDELGNNEERARRFVGTLNDALDPDYLDVSARLDDGEYLWGGSLRKVDGGIDFTQTAAARASDLLLLLGFIAYAKGEVGFDQIWATLRDGSGALAGAQRAINRMSGPDGLGGRLLAGQDLDFDEGAAAAAVKSRLKALWDRLCE